MYYHEPCLYKPLVLLFLVFEECLLPLLVLGVLITDHIDIFLLPFYNLTTIT
jgi:hypothetical protein